MYIVQLLRWRESPDSCLFRKDAINCKYAIIYQVAVPTIQKTMEKPVANTTHRDVLRD